MPTYARRTRPSRMSRDATNSAVRDGMAKQIPCAPEMIAVLTPTTSPHDDTSGPPAPEAEGGGGPGRRPPGGPPPPPPVGGVLPALPPGPPGFATPALSPWTEPRAVMFAPGAGFPRNEGALWLRLEDVPWAEPA